MGNIRILIVDDDHPMRTFIKATIRSSFPDQVIEINEAASVELAMTSLSTRPCDIVLCDWNLPKLKGTHLLVWMKGQGNLENVPFLMLTANNQKDIITDAISLGVKDFIMKPVTAEALSKRLRAAFKSIASPS